MTSNKQATKSGDSGNVAKCQSIGTPKREYQCTKLERCLAVFTCNSLRRVHTAPSRLCLALHYYFIFLTLIILRYITPSVTHFPSRT